MSRQADFKLQPCRNSPDKKDNCGHPFGKWPESNQIWDIAPRPIRCPTRTEDPWRTDKFRLIASPATIRTAQIARSCSDTGSRAMLLLQQRGSKLHCCHGGLKENTDAPLMKGRHARSATTRLRSPLRESAFLLRMGTRAPALNPIP